MNREDLRVEVYRSNSQIVTNKPVVAVRLTHMPTGTVGYGEDRDSLTIAFDLAEAELEKNMDLLL